jgi:outer membrane protein TolC
VADRRLRARVADQRHAWPDDALVRAAGYGGWTVEAGVAIRIPLGDRARRAAVAAARARLVEARTQIAEVDAAVAATTARERHRLRLAARRRVALTRSIELAEANLAAETRRWERGDGTTFDVLRRQSLLADARLRAVRARVDELDARAGLDAATGRLLARYGVEVP